MKYIVDASYPSRFYYFFFLEKLMCYIIIYDGVRTVFSNATVRGPARLFDSRNSYFICIKCMYINLYVREIWTVTVVEHA